MQSRSFEMGGTSESLPAWWKWKYGSRRLAKILVWIVPWETIWNHHHAWENKKNSMQISIYIYIYIYMSLCRLRYIFIQCIYIYTAFHPLQFSNCQWPSHHQLSTLSYSGKEVPGVMPHFEPAVTGPGIIHNQGACKQSTGWLWQFEDGLYVPTRPHAV